MKKNEKTSIGEALVEIFFMFFLLLCTPVGWIGLLVLKIIFTGE